MIVSLTAALACALCLGGCTSEITQNNYNRQQTKNHDARKNILSLKSLTSQQRISRNQTVFRKTPYVCETQVSASGFTSVVQKS